jgi:hypothetical protein
MSSFCLGCGNSLLEEERFCGACGRDSQASPAVPIVDPQVAFGLLPETSGKAIFSLISGLLFLILPFSIVAVIFGHLSLSEIRKSAGRLKGKGLAVTGIILGYVGVTLIVGLIGLGIYGQRVARKAIAASHATSENSVVTSVRTLNTAEIAYAQAHRSSGYTCSLSELKGAWGISSDLAKGRKNGYVFELKECTATKAGGPIVNYKLVAYPAPPIRVSVPAYCSDQSDLIRVARNGSPQDCLSAGIDLPESEFTYPSQISR